MRVVALVSGGKDSIMAMLKCREYGHELVALANLAPANAKLDEVDSYMYQTIGHAATQALAQATGLPLFQGRIRGRAVDQSLRYVSGAQRVCGEGKGSPEEAKDEVEDLHALLERVKRELPGSVEAVSSGAVLSNYQRYRVEHVCGRLGLTSLAYLWQRDQSELLADILNSGVDAIVVKTASMGLDPRKHLGKPLRALFPYLTGAFKEMGCHPCGEGGEYETFTLDCPIFRQRLAIQRSRVVEERPGDDDESGREDMARVGVLRFEEIQLVPKKAREKAKPRVVAPGSATAERKAAVIPPLTQQEDRNLQIEENLHASVNALFKDSKRIQAASANLFGPVSSQAASSLRAAPRTPLSKASNTAFAFVHAETTGSAKNSVETAVAAVLDQMEARLKARGLGMKDVMYVHLFLSDLSLFSRANAVYKRRFREAIARSGGSYPGAPSRCCVEVTPENGGPSVQIDALASSDPRSVLHVESVSEWAPACIGPYSQATRACGVVWLAGQIALDPPTMRLDRNAAESEQVSASVRHCDRVLRALGAPDVASVSLVWVVFWAWSEAQPSAFRVLDTIRRSVHAHAKKGTVQLVFIRVPRLPRDAIVEIQVMGVDVSAPCAPIDTKLHSLRALDGASGDGWAVAGSVRVAKSLFLSVFAELLIDSVPAEPKRRIKGKAKATTPFDALTSAVIRAVESELPPVEGLPIHPCMARVYFDPRVVSRARLAALLQARLTRDGVPIECALVPSRGMQRACAIHLVFSRHAFPPELESDSEEDSNPGPNRGGASSVKELEQGSEGEQDEDEEEDEEEEEEEESDDEENGDPTGSKPFNPFDMMS